MIGLLKAVCLLYTRHVPWTGKAPLSPQASFSVVFESYCRKESPLCLRTWVIHVTTFTCNMLNTSKAIKLASEKDTYCWLHQTLNSQDIDSDHSTAKFKLLHVECRYEDWWPWTINLALTDKLRQVQSGCWYLGLPWHCSRAEIIGVKIQLGADIQPGIVLELR